MAVLVEMEDEEADGDVEELTRDFMAVDLRHVSSGVYKEVRAGGRAGVLLMTRTVGG